MYQIADRVLEPKVKVKYTLIYFPAHNDSPLTFVVGGFVHLVKWLI